MQKSRENVTLNQRSVIITAVTNLNIDERKRIA